jgi:hypothetical protein
VNIRCVGTFRTWFSTVEWVTTAQSWVAKYIIPGWFSIA